MAYSKQTWANGAAGNTPLDAARLGYMEGGIEAVAAQADSLASTKVTNVQGVTGIWTGTQAAYDAIGTKSATTLYVIV